MSPPIKGTYTNINKLKHSVVKNRVTSSHYILDHAALYGGSISCESGRVRKPLMKVDRAQYDSTFDSSKTLFDLTFENEFIACDEFMQVVSYPPRFDTV